MDYTGKRVLLLDGYGRQIPSLLRQLHRLSCVVTTLCDSRLDVGFTSRYPARRIVEPGIREDAELLRRVIDRELASGCYDVIFPVIERSTDILSAYVRDGKVCDVKVLCAPYDAFVRAYDKQQTMTACMDHGIPCPLTRRDGEDLTEFISRAGFPLACKPRRGSGSAGFKKVAGPAELDAYIADGSIRPEEYVIQQYIPQSGHMFNCYVFMDDAHEPMFALPVETSRWFPPDGGAGCFAQTVDRPDVTESAVKLLRALGWAGMGQVSFMSDPRDGSVRVTEINGRISAGIRICEVTGCDPVKYLLDRAYGEPMTPVSHRIPTGIGLRYFHTDILWLLKSPNRWKTKPNWFDFRKNVDYIFSWSDPLPFFSYAVEHILSYKKDMEKRKH